MEQKKIHSFDYKPQKEEEEQIDMERVVDYDYSFREEKRKSMNTIDVFMNNREKRNKINTGLEVLESLSDTRSAIFDKIEFYIKGVMNKMAKRAGMETQFNEMSRGELLVSMKKMSEKKEFQNTMKEMIWEDDFQETWKAEYEAMQLGFDIETSKKSIRDIINPYTLKKEHMIAVKLKSSIGNTDILFCIGTESVISGIYVGMSEFEHEMMKEIISDEAVEILPEHTEALRKNVKSLERLLNSFQRKAEAFLVGEEISNK